MNQLETLKIINDRYSLIKGNTYLNSKINYYIDYEDFLRRNTEYRNYMIGMLNRAGSREYFNKRYIEQILRLHLQGRENHAMLFENMANPLTSQYPDKEEG